MSHAVHQKILTISGHGTVDVPIEQFNSLGEANKALGELEALRLLNYAHEITQRERVRRGKCPKCNGDCGFFNRPYCCGR